MVRVGNASKVEKETSPIFKSCVWPFIQERERERSHGGKWKKAGEDRPKLFWHSVMVSVWIIWFTTYLHSRSASSQQNSPNYCYYRIVCGNGIGALNIEARLLLLTKARNSQLDQIFSFGKTSSLSELGTSLWMIVKVNGVAERGEELGEDYGVR